MGWWGWDGHGEEGLLHLHESAASGSFGGRQVWRDTQGMGFGLCQAGGGNRVTPDWAAQEMGHSHSFRSCSMGWSRLLGGLVRMLGRSQDGVSQTLINDLLRTTLVGFGVFH